MYSNNNAGISPVTGTTPAATSKNPVSKKSEISWYSAMATAWGSALDKQADRLVKLSSGLSNGGDDPAIAVQLSAESHKLTFLSTAASTANNSAGQALETLARKQ